MVQRDDKFYKSLVSAGIISLVGAVWVLSMNVAQLQALYQSQKERIDSIEKRIDTVGRGLGP